MILSIFFSILTIQRLNDEKEYLIQKMSSRLQLERVATRLTNRLFPGKEEQHEENMILPRGPPRTAWFSQWTPEVNWKSYTYKFSKVSFKQQGLKKADEPLWGQKGIFGCSNKPSYNSPNQCRGWKMFFCSW